VAFRSYRMDWRGKALAFRVLDAAPRGDRLYYQLQKRVTKTVPRQLSPTAATARRFLEHIDAARRLSPGDLGQRTLFEFGAGWDLYGNLVAWCCGVGTQLVYDMRRWVRPDQVNVVIRHLMQDPPAGAVRIPDATLPEDDGFDAALREQYGIDYRAPADAGETGLPDACVDLIFTTSVLEHVPEAALRRLMVECRRLARPGAVISHVIDYSDHYAHADPAIGPYNFLRFNETAWQAFNPGIHFQNRLRHADYLRLFDELGFRLLEERAEQPDDAAAVLAGLPLAARFRDRPVAELAPTLGHVVLTVER
jgi:Methyltransferase domain